MTEKQQPPDDLLARIDAHLAENDTPPREARYLHLPPPGEVVARYCGRCRTNHVQDHAHTGVPGEFCTDCIDRCHDSELADHACEVCRWQPPYGTPVDGQPGYIHAPAITGLLNHLGIDGQATVPGDAPSEPIPQLERDPDAPNDLAPCYRCDGRGLLANSEDREPWTVWENLPPGSDLAVRFGIVRPIPCHICHGTACADGTTRAQPLRLQPGGPVTDGKVVGFNTPPPPGPLRRLIRRLLR